MTTTRVENALEIIAETRRLLETPRQWVRGIGAADAEGRECPEGSPAADAFCLDRALRRAAGAAPADGPEAIPVLRDVHDAIARRLERERTGVTHDARNPEGLVIAWNDETCCTHNAIHEVLCEAEQRIRVRGRAREWAEGPEKTMRSTGDEGLDSALWNLVDTLSNENEGNGELIVAGEDVLHAWQRWQHDFS